MVDIKEKDIILDYECMGNILIWTNEAEQLKQQILQDHETIERLKAEFRLYDGSPKENPQRVFFLRQIKKILEGEK